LCPEVNIDTELDFNQIDGKFQRILSQMAPFGPLNPAPVFVTHNVFLAGNPSIVGDKHLKLNVKQQNSAIFESIGFGFAPYAANLKPDKSFSICYTIEENVWKEQKRIQLNIKAIRTE
jgi:single-stranded-DNA-specific exonuclease